MQDLSSVTATDRYSPSTELTGNIWHKLSSIFSVFLPSEPEWQSCISWWNHVYIQYGGPNSIKISCICPLINIQYRIPQNSLKTEIPQKWANFAARLKIPRSAENCGDYTVYQLYQSNCWLLYDINHLFLLLHDQMVLITTEILTLHLLVVFVQSSWNFKASWM